MFAVTWFRRFVAGLTRRRPGFAPGSAHVGFVVDKVELRQGFLQVLPFSCRYHSTTALYTHMPLVHLLFIQQVPDAV
jgi:hypothetical protein